MKRNVNRHGLAWVAAACAAALVSACGGGQGSSASQPPQSIGQSGAAEQPQVLDQGWGVSATGFSDALLARDPKSGDLWLSTAAAGRTFGLKFDCGGCSMSVQVGQEFGSAGEAVPARFETLEPGAYLDVAATNLDSGERRAYRLRALPPDYRPYAVSGAGAPADGDLYVASFLAPGEAPSYALMIGADGALRYYRRSGDGYLFDFKKTQLPGGEIRYSLFEGATGATRVFDKDFAPMRSLVAASLFGSDGYWQDSHDHLLISDKSYFLGTAEKRTVKDAPGRAGLDTKVVAAGFQLYDDQGRLAFKWLSSDHPELYACSTAGNDYGADYQDYAHWNSAMVDSDGDIVASFRHLDAVMKISRADGSIKWILGGPCDQFGLSPAQRFSHQHDARRAPDGRLTIFDDGNASGVSRILAFGLDEASKALAPSGAAPAFSDMRPAGALLPGARLPSVAMGSAQLLGSGRALAGWGTAGGAQSTAATEFDPATGKVLFELAFDPPPGAVSVSYRARRFR